MSESDVVADIRLALSTGEVRLLRNSVGVLQDRRGQYVTYGLGVGTSDLIGWKSRLIMPCDVGERLAVFCAIEVKTLKGRTAPERLKRQRAFIRTVRQAGGIAGIARTVEEARALLGY